MKKQFTKILAVAVLSFAFVMQGNATELFFKKKRNANLFERPEFKTNLFNTNQGSFMMAKGGHGHGGGGGIEQGTMMIGIGVGYNLLAAVFTATNSTFGSESVSSVPPLQLDFDYMVADKFSLGLGFHYQSFSLTYTDWVYTNSQGNTVAGTWTEKITKFNVGVRPLFHFGNGETLDMYAGLRVGFTNWSFTNDNPDPYYVSDNVRAGSLSVLALFGLTYYFTDNIGFRTELGIGSPYLVQVGVAFKF